MDIQVFNFTLYYNGIANTLKTHIDISPLFHPELTKKPPEFEKFNAIWDTGATNSVISKNVINKCNLNPYSMTEVFTAGGRKLSNVFIVNIKLPNNIMMSAVRVTEGEIVGNVDVLIGMDIINRGDLAITNYNGKTTMTFRIPSIKCIDFCKEQPTMERDITEMPKVGRNDPCPCGSGLKYKKCHGKH